MRVLPSREEDIASVPFKCQKDDPHGTRLEAARLLPWYKTRKDLKTNPLCVGPATTSRLPAGVAKHSPSLSTSMGSSEVQSSVDSNHISPAHETIETQDTTNQTVTEDDGTDGCVYQKPQEVSHDSQDESSSHPNNLRLVLSSSSRTIPFNLYGLRQGGTSASTDLPAHSDSLWYPIVRSTSTNRISNARFPVRQSNSINAEPLNSCTGAMVLYQPNAAFRRGREISRAVQELSEQVEILQQHHFRMENPTVATAFRRFLAAYQVCDSWSQMTSRTTAQDSSRQQNHHPDLLLGSVESLPSARFSQQQSNAVIRATTILAFEPSNTSQNGRIQTAPSNSFDVSAKTSRKEQIPRARTSPTTGILRHLFEHLDAGHRAEIKKLKQAQNENLQICANDLQEEQNRTKSAKTRAVRANRQLQARRDGYQKLEEDLAAERARSIEAQVRLSEADITNETLRQERNKLRDLLTERNDDTRVLRRERDQALADCQRLVRDQVTPQRQIIERLQSQTDAVYQQMQQAVKGNQDLQRHFQRQFQHLTEQLERQKILNKALSETRVARYVENPVEREDYNVVRPDQLRDLQQALLVSQAMHAQQMKDTERLATILENKEEELSEATQQIADLRVESSLLKSCKALTIDLRKAYEKSFLQFAADNKSGDCPGLAAAAREVIAKEQAMTRECVNLSINNSEKEATIAFLKRQHVKELAAKEIENARLLRQVSDIDAEAFSNEIKVINLTEDLDASKEDLASSIEAAARFRRQLEYRAYGEDHEVTSRMVSRELKQARDTIASQQEDLIQQQLRIHGLDEDLNMARLQMDYLRPAKGWRLRFYEADTILRAFRDRFASELKLEPLAVDTKSIAFVYEGENVEAYYDFDENDWMTARFGPDWEQHPDTKASQDEELAAGIARLLAAVNDQATKRRLEEFQDMASMGLLEEMARTLADQSSADTSEVSNSESSLEATEQEGSETSSDDSTEGGMSTLVVAEHERDGDQVAFDWDRDTF